VPGAERLPWAGLLVLAGTTFVVVTGEMLPTAVLPVLAADLQVPVARAGLLVSIWAATVVLASFPLVRLTARLDRRHVIAAALAVFAGGNLVTALSGTFAVAAGSRIVAAAATGLLWATVNAHAAAIVPEHRIGRAASVVLGAGTLGTVVAVPAGNAAAQLWGWRPVFVALTLLALVAAAAVLSLLPPAPRSFSAGAGAGAGAGADADADAGADAGVRGAGSPAGGPGTRRPLRPVVVLAGLGGLVLAAHFAAFTFVTTLLADHASAVPTSVLLLLFGLLSAAGVALAGQLGDRFVHGTVLAVAALVAASLAALLALGLHPAVDLAVVAVWGISSGAVGPAVQTGMMRAAGAEHRQTAGTLLPVAFNLGIAIGAAGGSVVVERLSLDVLPPLAAALAVLATATLWLTGRRQTRRRTGRRPLPDPARRAGTGERRAGAGDRWAGTVERRSATDRQPGVGNGRSAGNGARRARGGALRIAVRSG